MSRILCIESKYAKDYLPYDLSSEARHVWIERQQAETDESFRQIIPYIAIVRRSDSKVLVYDRKGTEKRLHGLSSVGIGGHVDYPETWSDGARRELLEEAGIPIHENIPLRPLGKIVFSETAVDRVHLGLAFWIDVESASPKDELLNARWLSITDALRSRMEMWSIELLSLLKHELIRSFDVQSQR